MNGKVTAALVALLLRGGLGLGLLTLSAMSLAAPCSDAVDRHSPILQNGFGGGIRNNRNPPSTITSHNVSQLRLALTHAAPLSNPDGSKIDKRGAPAVTQQAVFFSAGRSVIAMNRNSGCTYWTYDVPARSGLQLGNNAVRSSAIYFLDGIASRPALVIAGDFFGNLHAVDATTGKPVWTRFVGTAPEHHMITGAPQFFDGKLLVPVASKEVLTSFLEARACCTSHGLLQAVDPYTGATIWTYHTSADAKYVFATQTNAPNGMSLWGSPAIDADRGLVYVGTGQNLSRPTTPNSDSIIALELATGKPVWVFQSTAGDAWNMGCSFTPISLDCKLPPGPDHDFGAPPVLVRTSTGEDAVIAGGKNGVVYSLDPDTGALNWSRRVGQGGVLGGIHWGMASDGVNIYVGVNDLSIKKTAPQLEVGLLRQSAAPVPNARPGIYALDLVTGSLVWESHPQHLSNGALYNSAYSAALTVANDVLFAGSLDGRVRAFRTSDGAELWSANTAVSFSDVNGVAGKGGGIDSVGPVVAGGDLLINTGYVTFGGVSAYHAGPGNGLFIYRLQ